MRARAAAMAALVTLALIEPPATGTRLTVNWTTAEVRVHCPSDTERATLYVPFGYHSWAALSDVVAVVEVWSVCCESPQFQIHVRFWFASVSVELPVNNWVVFTKVVIGPCGLTIGFVGQLFVGAPSGWSSRNSGFAPQNASICRYGCAFQSPH